MVHPAVFDCRPLSHEYKVSPTPQSADGCTIASDFWITGDDMRADPSEYDRTQ